MNLPRLVTAAIIQREKNEYLITQRPKGKFKDLWEFPGGGVEFGEEPMKCTEREVEEETGLIIKARNFFDYSSWVYDKETHIVLMAFNCDYISGEVQHLQVQDHRWVSPSEMIDYKFCPGDYKFIDKLREERD